MFEKFFRKIKKYDLYKEMELKEDVRKQQEMLNLSFSFSNNLLILFSPFYVFNSFLSSPFSQSYQVQIHFYYQIYHLYFS